MNIPTFDFDEHGLFTLVSAQLDGKLLFARVVYGEQQPNLEFQMDSPQDHAFPTFPADSVKVKRLGVAYRWGATGRKFTRLFSWEELRTLVHATIGQTLAEAKEQKRSEIHAAYSALHSQGFTTPWGWRMPYDAADRSAYHELLTFTRAALASGIINTQSEVVMADIDRMDHNVEAGELEGLAISYGLTYQALWQRLPQALRKINEAETIQALEDIEL